MYSILQYFNETNSTNDKIKKLKEYKDNELFVRVLEMAYDKVRFTYGVTMKNVVTSRKMKQAPFLPLSQALDKLDLLCSREATGNNAIALLGTLCDQLSSEDEEVLRLIIGRDLKINIGRSNINKVHKGLIVKPAYKRCGVFNKKTMKKLVFPCYIQLKADGTYREFLLKEGKVTCVSRSGESYEYPLITEDFIYGDYKDGYYFGELTVKGITNRSEGNGIINSDECPHDDLILSLWEYCTEDEYTKAVLKVKGDMPQIQYSVSFDLLSDMIAGSDNSHIELIETHIVNSAIEAMQQCVKWMQADFEGGVSKNFNMIMKDGTSLDQLKMKLEIAVEVRMVGYKPGKKGTKREGKVGSIQFANDEGTVQGYASGFNDKMLDDITENMDKYMNKVFCVICNDITKGRDNDYHALSHPRFDEWRNDKDTTDSLERMFELKESAMLLKDLM